MKTSKKALDIFFLGSLGCYLHLGQYQYVKLDFLNTFITLSKTYRINRISTTDYYKSLFGEIWEHTGKRAKFKILIPHLQIEMN